MWKNARKNDLVKPIVDEREMKSVVTCATGDNNPEFFSKYIPKVTYLASITVRKVLKENG